MANSKPRLELPFKLEDLVPPNTYLPGQEAAFEGTNEQYFNALMGLQLTASAEAKKHTEIDRACRIEVQKMLYPDGYPTDGSTGRMDGIDKFSLWGGWELEFEKRVSVKLDEAQLPAIREVISKLPVDPETGEVPSLGNAVRYKPELSESAYGNLREDVRAILNEALTFTPGTPGIKAAPPKVKAKARSDDQKATAS